jgi:hypothetical protein
MLRKGIVASGGPAGNFREGGQEVAVNSLVDDPEVEGDPRVTARRSGKSNRRQQRVNAVSSSPRA